MSNTPPEHDPLDYQLLIRDALRGVIRRALDIVADQGLPGEHFFSITFLTQWEGIELPPILLAQYPEQMTILLQHQFWDLSTDEKSFSVTLSFGGRQQRLKIPFAAITTFVDPGAEFALQLTTAESEEPAETAAAEVDEETAAPRTGQVVSLDAFRQR